jgi:hypothetical protein
VITKPESSDERLRALGLLTVRFAKLEEEIREAFCALVGSEYAVVVAGGQGMSWLIDQCQALVRANLEMSDGQKAEITTTLDQCRAANSQRNTLIHSVKFDAGNDEGMLTSRSQRGTFTRNIESWTNESIRMAVSQISAARFALHDAIRGAVSDEAFRRVHALSEEARVLHDRGHL